MLRESKSLDLFDCLSLELRLGRSILQNPDSDFFRGVNALLVDKTGSAQWLPRDISDVTEQVTSSHFQKMSVFGLPEFSPN